MKFSAANLKNVDYKKLLINHGEKIGLGVVALLVLLVLYGTRWSRYEGTPEEMSDAAEDAAAQLEKSQWSPELQRYVMWTAIIAPQQELWPDDVKTQVAQAQATLQKQIDGPEQVQQLQAEAPKDNLLADVDRMFSGVAVARYLYGNDGQFMKSIYQRREPLRLPDEWLAVQDLRAVSGQFVMPTRSDEMMGMEGEMLAAEGMEPPKDPMFDDPNLTDEQKELMRRLGALDQPIPGAAGAEGMLPGGPAAGHMEAPAAGPGGGSPRGSRGGGAGFSPPMMAGGGGAGYAPGLPGETGMPGAYGDYLSYVEGSYSGSGATGRGVRYVCVTGIYPFRQQFETLYEAMNEPSGVSPYDLLQLTKFELQRQTARPGTEMWSDRDEDWETVDIQSSLDVLNEAADFMPDIVPPNYRDAVITSPLPARGMGEWIAADVSHPEIKQLMGKEQRALELMMADYLASQKELQASGVGGFAGLMTNVNDMRRDMVSGMGSEQFIEGMGRQIYSAADAMPGMNPQYFETQMEGSGLLTTQTDVMLFRYFDFAVDPGQTYRYRVRLVVRNPAEGLPNVLTPEVAEGATRTTPWSEPTEPVAVPRDARYFLADAEPARGRADAPKALINIYQWFASIGTSSKPLAPVEVRPGQFIGSTAKALVLEPLIPALEEKEQPFATGDLLIDVAAAPQQLDGNHPDLALATGKKAALPLADKAVVIDEFGQLVLVDSASNQRQREFQEMVLTYQNRRYESIKGLQAQQAEDPMGIEELLMDGMSADMMGAEGAGDRGKPRKTKLRAPMGP